MSLTVPESGTIHFVKPEGSVLEPGELLATVVLEDPSKVHKAERFTGTLPSYESVGALSRSKRAKSHVLARKATRTLAAVMNGYDIPWEQVSSGTNHM